MASENNRAYSAATTRLRQAHRDEFEKLLVEEYANRGLVYRPRMSAAEREQRDQQLALTKAKRRVDTLVAKYGWEVVPQRVGS